jgi:MYXO-CTERM domain-containing protein
MVRVPVARAAFLVVAALAAGSPVQAQAASAPDFAVGDAVVYCHASEDSLSVWMNTLVDDGGGTPYYLFGASTATVPVVGAGVDPVVSQAFEARIPLTPTLAQDIVVAGTVSVQAYIGGGTFTAGRGSIATALAVDGTDIGSADAKTHDMTPSLAGQTYSPISWTFEVPEITVTAGSVVEWVLRGTVTAGNNIFMACHEARGRSAIMIPITALPVGGDAPEAPTDDNSTTNGTTAPATTSTSGTSSSSSSSATSASETSSGPSGASNSTRATEDNSTSSDSKDSPGLALPLLLATGVVALAAWRRRA